MDVLLTSQVVACAVLLLQEFESFLPEVDGLGEAWISQRDMFGFGRGCVFSDSNSSRLADGFGLVVVTTHPSY